MFAVGNGSFVCIEGEEIASASDCRVNFRINRLATRQQCFFSHDDGDIGWNARRVHRAIPRDRAMQTAVGVLLRAAMPEGAVFTLPLGEGHGVFIDPVQHGGIGGTIRDTAQVILAEENVDVGPVPSVAARWQGQIRRSQRVGKGLQASLHGGVIRIARSHAREQSQRFNGTAVVVR